METGEEKRKIQAAWIEYIEGLGEQIGGWEWFGNWTFRKDRSPENALKLFARLQHQINLVSYGINYQNKPYLGMSSVIAIEYQNRDVIHFHTLDGHTQNFKRLTAMDYWAKFAGFARVYPFRKKGGAEAYVTKYILKDKSKRPALGGPIVLQGPFHPADSFNGPVIWRDTGIGGVKSESPRIGTFSRDHWAKILKNARVKRPQKFPRLNKNFLQKVWRYYDMECADLKRDGDSEAKARLWLTRRIKERKEEGGP